MIDELDKKIIGFLQRDLPVEPRPYKIIADQLGIDEDMVLSRIQAMIDRGIIRRFGATLYHQGAGFRANAIAAWNVPEKMIDEIGKKMAELREVTHCYQRRATEEWRYNLYTMIHGPDRDQCISIAEEMSRMSGIKDYTLLFSEKEFKKTSMEYY
ncbi:MAG: AsnC family transcriptional regulator [Deltaproteobacteria bacterium]|nr:AsnC family transcriptional regulator [Deltaproteobacteria bacterium]